MSLYFYASTLAKVVAGGIDNILLFNVLQLNRYLANKLILAVHSSPVNVI